MKSIKNLSTTEMTEMAFDSTVGLTEEELRMLELELVEPREKELVSLEFFPVSSNVPAWLKNVSYNKVTDRNLRSKDDNQQNTFVTELETEIALVDQAVKQNVNPIYRQVLGTVLPWREVEAAREMGVNLEVDKAALLRRAHAETIERVNILGDSQVGFDGVADTTDVIEVNPIEDNSETEWGLKDADLIVEDIGNLAQPLIATPGAVPPFDMLLSQEAYSQLATRYVALPEGGTALALTLVQNHPLIDRILWTPFLDDVSDERVAILADNQPQFHDVLLPAPMTMLPPKETDTGDVLLRSYMVTGGLRIKDDQAIARMSDI